MKKKSTVDEVTSSVGNDGRSIPEQVQALVDELFGKGVAKAVPFVVEDTHQHVRPKHPDAFCRKCMADGSQAWFGGCEECEDFEEAMRNRYERHQ